MEYFKIKNVDTDVIVLTTFDGLLADKVFHSFIESNEYNNIALIITKSDSNGTVEDTILSTYTNGEEFVNDVSLLHSKLPSVDRTSYVYEYRDSELKYFKELEDAVK